MYDYLLRHKVLMTILEHKFKYEMKKDVFFSLQTLYGYFKDDNKLSALLLNLQSEDYIKIKKEGEVKMINIEEKGVFAANNKLFLEKNHKLIWEGIRNYGMLIANIAVAIVAIVALTRDDSKFAGKDDVLQLQSQITTLKLQLHQERSDQQKTLSQMSSQVDSLLHTKNSSPSKDTPVLDKIPVTKKRT
jgi:hypothetical protein